MIDPPQTDNYFDKEFFERLELDYNYLETLAYNECDLHDYFLTHSDIGMLFKPPKAHWPILLFSKWIKVGKHSGC